MPDQKLETGDLFENARASWIREKFPRYEEIWSEYIGHNGRGQALEMKGLTENQLVSRHLFVQAHYSLALFSYLLDRHTTESIAGLQKSAEEGTHRSAEAYLRDTANFCQFIGLLGQVCDMAEDIATALGEDEIRKKVLDFAKERSHAIHAARIPMKHDAYGVKIAAIAKLIPEKGEWDKGVTWDMADVTKFKYLEDWMRDARNALLETLRKVVWPIIAKGAAKTFPRSVKRAPSETGSDPTLAPRAISSTDQKSQEWWIPPSGQHGA